MTVDGGRVHRDEGSALVEFVTLGVLVLLPVVYLVVTLGRIQAASFATDGGARAAARAFVSAPDEARAAASAEAAVRLALLDQGFRTRSDGGTGGGASGPGGVVVECSERPCLTPGGRVVVRVSVDVVLPGVPAALDAVLPTHVTIRSTQVATVDAFRAVAP